MHGWSFDLFTGKCLNHSTSKLKKYQIIELDDKIYIKKLTETKPKWML
jgi:nitrite reductase/ring-hydroxylating ferredoxin subunit